MKLGMRFYDERNDRYIILDGVGADPNVWYCLIEEAYNGEFETVGSQLFTERELKRFKEIA